MELLPTGSDVDGELQPRVVMVRAAEQRRDERGVEEVKWGPRAAPVWPRARIRPLAHVARR
jgi:hypothetical protein